MVHIEGNSDWGAIGGSDMIDRIEQRAFDLGAANPVKRAHVKRVKERMQRNRARVKARMKHNLERLQARGITGARLRAYRNAQVAKLRAIKEHQDQKLAQLISGEEIEIGGRFRRRRRRIRARRKVKRRRIRARRKDRRRRGKGFLAKVGKGFKFIKKIGTAAAFIFPPAAPAVLGMKLAAKIGKKIKNRRIRKLVRHTAAVAKRGNRDARQGLQLLALAKKMNLAAARRKVEKKRKVLAYVKAHKKKRRPLGRKKVLRPLRGVKRAAKASRLKKLLALRRLLKKHKASMPAVTGIVISPSGVRQGRWAKTG